RSLITQFENLVEEGSSYLIENFVVGKNDTKLRTTRHKFKLNFMGNTKCESSEADNIPTHSFSFQSFKLILDGMDDAFLIDIIEHVVEKDEMKELVKNGKTNKLIEFVLEDLESNKLTCTLWGDYAEKMHQYLMNNDSGGPIIVILHQCKLKTFNGQVG
ncbi:DUF223 domain-containing protein, partial [Escherichia coli]|nr:DUF223 domain-containing protein [Escherichia coli]